MRRLVNDRVMKERGAVSVLVAILMVVMLGFTAIAVDVGLLHSERAQLQNGADASAIAMAQECARNSSSTDCSTTSPLAGGLANQNALDGMSNVFAIELDKAAQKVSVTTSAKETGGEKDSVSLFFANIFGFASAEVGARSSAVWGSPRAGRTPFPLAFSICQVKGSVGSPGPIQRLQSHSTSGNTANNKCKNASGTEVPGGFGWLPTASDSCSAHIDLGANSGWVNSDPGVDHPALCSATLYKWADELNANRQVIAYLPVFDAVSGQGNNAKFHLSSFAAFEVIGWKFTGADGLPYTFRNLASAATGVTASTECGGSCRGVIGRFVKYVSLSEDFTLGPVDPNGALIVRYTL